MVPSAAITVRFWGVRGHIPVPGPETAAFGGNTACIEVRCGEHLLIFDAGTGIRLLGQKLAHEGSVDADLFFSHSQFDHICGLPFFAAAFNPANSFRVWAGHLEGDATIKGVLAQLMTDPIFPVPLTIMKAALDFRDFRAGETLTPKPGVVLRTAGFNWTRPVTGYRIEHGGRAVCYLSDVKHNLEVNADSVVEFISDADLVVFNAAIDPSMEDPARADGCLWGIELTAQARVRTLVLTNHRHDADDSRLREIADDLARTHPGTVIAYEGLAIEV